MVSTTKATAADAASKRLLAKRSILFGLPLGSKSSLGSKNRQTPVIFLSARDEDYARLKGLGLGADDYITKPFLPEELLLRVKAVLKRTFHMEETLADDTSGNTRVDWNAGIIRTPKEEYTLTAKSMLLKKTSCTTEIGKAFRAWAGDKACQTYCSDASLERKI